MSSVGDLETLQNFSSFMPPQPTARRPEWNEHNFTDYRFFFSFSFFLSSSATAVAREEQQHQ